MIEAIIYFLLGACSILLILTLGAPLVWKRALFLAKKQVEARNPLTLEDIQTDRDMLKTHYATELFRKEYKYNSLQKRLAEAESRLSQAQIKIKLLKQLEHEMHTLQKFKDLDIKYLDLQKKLNHTDKAYTKLFLDHKLCKIKNKILEQSFLQTPLYVKKLENSHSTVKKLMTIVNDYMLCFSNFEKDGPKMLKKSKTEIIELNQATGKILTKIENKLKISNDETNPSPSHVSNKSQVNAFIKENIIDFSLLFMKDLVNETISADDRKELLASLKNESSENTNRLGFKLYQILSKSD